LFTNFILVIKVMTHCI